MKDQNWRNLLDDQRQKVQCLIRYAQLQQHDKANHARYHHALQTLLLAEKGIKQIIDDVKAAIADHDKHGETLKERASILREACHKSVSPDPAAESVDKGKGKASDCNDVSGLDISEDKDLPLTPAGEEHALKKRSLQLRLREYNVILHKVIFLQVRQQRRVHNRKLIITIFVSNREMFIMCWERHTRPLKMQHMRQRKR
jgi:E3 ubiquitin-protein ligase SHPRH